MEHFLSWLILTGAIRAGRKMKLTPETKEAYQQFWGHIWRLHGQLKSPALGGRIAST